MHFGASNAITYALQKGFGIINVYYKDRIIANSVIWIDEFTNSLIIDNIEVHPNYEKFNNYIKNLYSIAIPYIQRSYKTNCTLQGINYNDLELYKQKTISIQIYECMKPKDIKHTNFYSDTQNGAKVVYGSLKKQA